MQKTGIYAIYDKLAEDLIGGLHAHRAEPAAIRMFTDVAGMEGSRIGMHPNDYTFVRLGWLEHKDGQFTIVPDYAVVLEGSAWAAVQQNATPTNS